MLNSALNPVSNGLRIELESLGDLGDREELAIHRRDAN
jgi:hypothetical protein